MSSHLLRPILPGFPNRIGEEEGDNRFRLELQGQLQEPCLLGKGSFLYWPAMPVRQKGRHHVLIIGPCPLLRLFQDGRTWQRIGEYPLCLALAWHRTHVVSLPWPCSYLRLAAMQELKGRTYPPKPAYCQRRGPLAITLHSFRAGDKGPNH